MARNAHPTKSGPGRRHADGEKHGKPPVADKGHFAGQHKASPLRADRRRAIKELGIRQFKRQQYRERDLVREVAA